MSVIDGCPLSGIPLYLHTLPDIHVYIRPDYENRDPGPDPGSPFSHDTGTSCTVTESHTSYDCVKYDYNIYSTRSTATVSHYRLVFEIDMVVKY